MEVGYMDLKITVVEFWKGLDLQIQNTIATMAYGRPSDSIPDAWYEAAKNVDQNRAANKAFKLASRIPVPATISTRTTPSVPIHLGPPSLLQILPSVLRISSTPVNLTPLNCYWCHKPGHLATDCPQKHDIWTLSIEEIEMALLVKKDVVETEDPPVAVKKADTEDFVQDSEWKAHPHCPHVIMSRY